ncbi:hypothetical protein ACUL41_07945 [Virgibacillus natechei]
MSQIAQAYMKQEWVYYDMNLGNALEAIIQRIAWALRSLNKYHFADRRELLFRTISNMQERVNR